LKREKKENTSKRGGFGFEDRPVMRLALVGRSRAESGASWVSVDMEILPAVYGWPDSGLHIECARWNGNNRQSGAGFLGEWNEWFKRISEMQGLDENVREIPCEARRRVRLRSDPPPGLKPRLIWSGTMYGLKPVPFN
jgi:hypothetical protein